MKNSCKRVLLITAVLVLMVLLTAGICYGETKAIKNGEAFTPVEGTKYTVKVNADTEVKVSTNSGYIRYYGLDSSCSDSNQEKWYGPCEDKIYKYEYFNCKTGTNYFKFEKARENLSEVTVTWEAVEVTNNTLDTAEALTIKKGKTKTIDLDGRPYYYTMKLSESGKYTFDAKESSVIYILKGKKDKDGENYWKLIRSSDSDHKQTYTMKKGTYTVIAYPVPSSGTGTISIKRLDWTGISKITCSATYSGEYGKTITYKVKYTPKDADSVISIKGTSNHSAGNNIKKVSQKNGVATFKIKISTLYDKNTAKKYRQYKVSTSEGISKLIEEKGGPKAAKIKSVVGDVKGGSVTVEKGQADKLVVQVKNGSKWKTLKTVTKVKSATPTINFKGLKPGKEYNLRVVSYANGAKGGTKTFKMITAYDTKPTKLKATCIKTEFKKGRGEYTEWDETKGDWVTKYESDKSIATVKVTFKKAGKSSSTYVHDAIRKSGKKFSITFTGKLTKSKTIKIAVRAVRKKGKLIAYGPTVYVKCKIKPAS